MENGLLIQQKIIQNYLNDNKIRNILFKYAMLFQRNNHHNAEELLQQTYIRIKELSVSLDTYIDDIDKFKGWSWIIMRYLSSNLNRKNSKRLLHDNIEINTNIELIDNPESLLINKERQESIETIKAIIINSKNLSDYTKTALIERMNGTSINEIAKKLGKNNNNTKTYIYTEIKRMPEYLTIRKIYEENIM